MALGHGRRGLCQPSESPVPEMLPANGPRVNPCPPVMPGLPRPARLRRERRFLRFLTKDGSSALHRIGEYQAVCRVCLRPIEASDNFWQRVFDIPAVAPPLELQVHVLKAGPRALARCADCPDPWAPLDPAPVPTR